MSDNSPAGSAPDGSGHRQDPIVERLRPDPSLPALRTTTLRGFLGDSELEGYQRLYFTKTLDYYVEFRSEDAVQISAIPADESPFPGEAATMVELPPGITINYVRARVTEETAPFDLDIRPASDIFGHSPGLDFPMITDSVSDPSCNIFDTTCTGAGCGMPNPPPTTYDCPQPERRRGRF